VSAEKEVAEQEDNVGRIQGAIVIGIGGGQAHKRRTGEQVLCDRHYVAEIAS
jgi:hypothetical protein